LTVGSKGHKSSYASDVITWTEEDRLTQLATGVARTADVFTLADHTFRAGERLSRRSYLMVQYQDKVESLQLLPTFTASCGDALGWTALGLQEFLFR
jgi:hypothetical protein